MEVEMHRSDKKRVFKGSLNTAHLTQCSLKTPLHTKSDSGQSIAFVCMCYVTQYYHIRN